MRQYKFVKGYSLVVAATAIWSGNFIVARVLAHSVPPVTLVVLRSAIAAIVLLPFVMRPLRDEITIIYKHLGYLALTAFLGLSVCNTLVYVAAETSTALNLTLIAICSPVFTLIFARLFLGDTLTFRRIIGLIAAMSGVVFLITDGQPARLAHLTFSDGDLWMLGQAASFALYSILVRMKPAELHPLTFLFSLFVLGLIVLLPWLAWELSGTKAIEVSPTIVGAILYLGIGPSLLAYLFWNQSVAIIGPSRAALVYYCLPLFGGGEALLLLGEPINAVHVLSGILILAGIVFATWE
ncbi:MAG: DMT family transporter [Desulfomonile tiedjei]|nr:DMT family transporter [Desulfomonile tiedjei]